MSKLGPVHIIGAGLAGSEAAYFLARHGVKVHLHEMRPVRMTEAHKTEKFAELVCSNSLKSLSHESAPGMLKAEMRALGSLVLQAGEKAAVPAGEALGVDREVFSELITAVLSSHPNITIERGEMSEPPAGGPTLIATGPLTSPALGKWLATATGADDLYFYDAIAPIIDATSVDMNHAFLANRYDKGEEQAYLNCPLTEPEYEKFIDALLAAEKVPPKSFEKEILFQGCQPIESIAAGGRESLRFGPMKPVGLTDPRTGRRPYAVVQLRPENRSRTAYNLVGFQTKLKYGEQKRVFAHIPALANAEFLRLGSIHRNTYVCGPKVLRTDLSLKGHPLVYLAGQVTGVEGYVESSACGLLAGLFMLQRLEGRPHATPPINTALGALLKHVTQSDPANYQPGNIHFGLFDPIFFENLVDKRRDDVRKGMAAQAIVNFDRWLASMPGIQKSKGPEESFPRAHTS
ncbi:MAG: methylenetetrahydrofolate--tRNA-(uracil(54)-C(5))-methyltransferase (FADH(2)-oxidizing) TrmFO [Bacteriovoracia bacterium]